MKIDSLRAPSIRYVYRVGRHIFCLNWFEIRWFDG